jgi:hypothetical protein
MEEKRQNISSRVSLFICRAKCSASVIKIAGTSISDDDHRSYLAKQYLEPIANWRMIPFAVFTGPKEANFGPKS